MKAEQYKLEISKILNVHQDNIFLYWKGRVALYAVLKAMGISENDEVVLPGFTCVVVPNAIKYLKAKPVYVDIDKDSLNVPLENIKKAITTKTKVIICQNTFGLSSNIEEIVKIANENNIMTIEDCTHGFGGLYNEKSNGSYCDAAFYSTQWNKPFSTGIGGFALINNSILLKEINENNKELIKPKFTAVLNLRLLLLAKKYVLNSHTYWFLRKVYRILSKLNIVVGSSSGEELEDVIMPENYFQNMSKVQINEGLKNIKEINRLIELRKKNAVLYTELLLKHNRYHVSMQLHENHSFLKYPVLVKDRDVFMEIAEKEKIEIGDWFCSPIHPIKNNFEKWDVDVEKIPNAVFCSRKIINFPTDVKKIDKYLLFIEKNIDLFI